VSEADDLAPVTLFEYDHQPGTYCLLLSDRHMVEADEVFRTCGRSNGGYGWDGVARSVLEHRLPDLRDQMPLDPVAGMCVAYGDDKSSLHTLGVVLRDALHNPQLLRELIGTGDPGMVRLTQLPLDIQKAVLTRTRGGDRRLRGRATAAALPLILAHGPSGGEWSSLFPHAELEGVASE
jgi:hypothetical protein